MPTLTTPWSLQLREPLQAGGVVADGLGSDLPAAAVDDDDLEGVLVTVDPCEHAQAFL
jgi:hypothetical protein